MSPPGSPPVTSVSSPRPAGSSPFATARSARWFAYDVIENIPVGRSDGKRSSSRSLCPSPTGTTVAPVASSDMWSAIPPA